MQGNWYFVSKVLIFSTMFALALAITQSQVHAQPFAYVANGEEASISVIDTATNTVTTTVAVGNRPVGMAVHPAGTFVYVTNAEDNTVSVLDTATNTVTATVTVGNTPHFIAINSTGSTVYVGNNGGNTVSVIDTSTNTVTATIELQAETEPYGVVVHPDDTFAYVAGNNFNTVLVIDTSTNTVNAVVGIVDSTGGGEASPNGVAIHPDGTFVYTANFGDTTVSVIDTSTNSVTATIPLAVNGNEHPQIVAIHPDGTTLYVTGVRGEDGDRTGDAFWVIDTATNTVTTSIKAQDGLGSLPLGIAVHPSGTFVYVANGNDGTISVIDTATNAITATVETGSFPVSVAVSPIEPDEGVGSPSGGGGGAPDITWDVTGVSLDKVICKNKTNGQKVRIDVSVPASGSCGDLGLTWNSGDAIQVKVAGTVDSVADAGGAVTGIAATLLVCKNKSTDPQEKVRVDAPPSSWNWSDAGLPMALGDQVQWKAKGPAK